MSHEPRLIRVKPNRPLFWPEELCMDQRERVWAVGGAVIDIGEAPLLASIAEKQWDKWAAAEPGAAPTWTSDAAPRLVARALLEQRLQNSKTTSKAAEATEREAREPETARPPAPTPGRAKRRAADIEAVLAEGAE